MVWNIFYCSIDWECHHPNWRTHIFQRDWNHQPKEYPYLPKCGFIRFSAANMGDFARNVDFEAWALPPASPSKCLCCRLAPWGGWNQQWMVIREGLDDFMVDSFKIVFANSFGWWITILILIQYLILIILYALYAQHPSHWIVDGRHTTKRTSLVRRTRWLWASWASSTRRNFSRFDPKVGEHRAPLDFFFDAILERCVAHFPSFTWYHHSYVYIILSP